MKKLPILGQEGPPTEAAGFEDFDASRELPTLHEALLDWDALDCVLADLDDFVQVKELQGRLASGEVLACATLVGARDELVAGEIQGLQITYDFADQTWIDTIIREPEGARLLRMLAPTRPG